MRYGEISKKYRNVILCGDVIKELKKLPDNIIDCVNTSPPYYAMRDYGKETYTIWTKNSKCNHRWKNYILSFNNMTGEKKSKILKGKGKENFQDFDRHHCYAICKKCGAEKFQLGLEPTVELYVKHICDILDEVKRILKPTGILFLNVGDTYIRKNLQLQLVPYRIALEMQRRGWIIRNIINWCKKILYYDKERNCWETKGNGLPECLDGNIKVIVKINDKIYNIKLKKLYDIYQKNKNILILSPTGFKKIKNIWITEKEKFISFDVGHSYNIKCSLNHKFPVSYDDRHKGYSIREAKDLIFKDRNQHELLFKPVGDIINKQESYYKKFDLVKGAYSVIDTKYLMDKVFIKFDRFNKKHKFIINLAKKYLENVELKKRIYKPCWFFKKIRNNLFPLKIVVEEKYNYNNEKIYINRKRGKNFLDTFIDLDYNFGKFVGFYVAEGNSHPNTLGYWNTKFTFHKKEKSFCNFVYNFIKKRLKGNCSLRIYKNTITINTYDVLVAIIVRFFTKGNSAKEKALNMEYILNTPIEFRRGLFEGMILGDGSIVRVDRNKKNKNKYSILYGSASVQLVKDFCLLASSLGYFANIYKYINKKGFNCFLGKISFSLQKKIEKGEVIKQGNQYVNTIWKNIFDAMTLKIRNNQIFEKKIKMYDLEVEDELFLIENGIVTHNSISNRFVKNNETIIMAVKSTKYFFNYDGLKLGWKPESIQRRKRGVSETNKYFDSKEENNLSARNLSLPRKNINKIKTKSKYKILEERTARHSNRAGFNRDIDKERIKKGLPDRKEFALWLKNILKERNIKEEFLEYFGKSKAEHWIRADKSGSQIPSFGEWLSIKKFLNLEKTPFDEQMENLAENNNSIKVGYKRVPNNWLINTSSTESFSTSFKGEKVYHYAIQPSKIAYLTLLHGCPPYVCAECGRPYKKKYKIIKQENGETQQIEEGWEKDCACKTDKKVAGLVLDPFAGIGTTLLKAKEMGFDYLGIEISKKYVEIADRRLKEKFGLFI